MSDPIEDFRKEVTQNISDLGKDPELHEITQNWMLQSAKHKYTYNFAFLGRPIIQYPQDMMAMQELVWNVQPDLIIETGIAHGGSLIMYAAFLELNAACGGNADARILGIDIDIRPHNREKIEAHPMARRIDMIQGSSIDAEIVAQVREKAAGYKTVMVVLDSNHTHDHVLEELRAYADLTTVGSYCVVFDTVVEDMPDSFFPDRPWGQGNNPKTAVWEYLKDDSRFEVDKSMDHKLQISVAPDGYLKRVS